MSATLKTTMSYSAFLQGQGTPVKPSESPVHERPVSLTRSARSSKRTMSFSAFLQGSPMLPGGMPDSERPRTGRNSATSERLTPMPEYMRPITKSAGRQWKKLHEDYMMNKLITKRQTKKEINQVTKQEAYKLAKKIPMEVLAKDWLSDNKATVETRAYLVDRVLPTLILGVEKLLTEVERKGLVDKDPSREFNPINFLAQYMMRNNPRYSNFSEASPYIRGLRQISEELRKELFDIEDNKLAKLKAEARRRRKVREQAENVKILEKERRVEALRKQFRQWNVKKKSSGRVELAVLQNALLSFRDLAEQVPSKMRPLFKFAQELEITDNSGRTVGKTEFVDYLIAYTESLSSEIFDQFLQHLSLCAKIYRAQIERDERRITLTQLFVACDKAAVGVIDRHRILELFELFWDNARDQIKSTLRDPRKWPVVEAQEVDIDNVSLSDNEDDQQVADESQPVQDAIHENDVEIEGNGMDLPLLTKAALGLEEETPRPESEPQEIPRPSESELDIASDESQIEKADNEKHVDESIDGDVNKSNEQDDEQNVSCVVDSAQDGSSEQPAIIQNENKANNDVETQDKQDNVTGPDEQENESKNDELNTAEIHHSEATEVEMSRTEKAVNEESEKETDEHESPEAKLADDPGADAELAQLMDGAGGPLAASGVPRPPMTQQSKVSFAEGTAFERERTAGLVASRGGSRSLSVLSAFDETTLVVNQFVQLVETFLGDEPYMAAFKQLVNFIWEGYMETEEERRLRLLKVRFQAQSARRKALLSSLFEIWDNDSSGFLDLNEVEDTMVKYKDGIHNEAIAKAKKEYKKKSRYHDNRLSKREFRSFVHSVVEHMKGADNFDYFVDFLLNSVERSYAERVRGEARKKWLQAIVNAADISGVDMEPLYKAVFQALHKDAEAHGGGKRISAYIALLERNTIAPLSRGDFYLRYVASTPEQAPFILGKCLFKDMKGISFASVESGKPIHVPRVSNHGNIHFWNTERSEEERDGSFIVVPLKDIQKQVFGLLGVDTLNDHHSRAIFITHEIQFFQGIARAFSIAYHKVDVRQKTMRISESAVSWICQRSPSVQGVVVYMVELDAMGQDYILRKMMTSDERGNPHMVKKPPKLERRDNLFRDYLFKCVDNSESVTADAYGECHLAVPLRNDQGIAIVVIDISIGKLKHLSKLESREVTKMLKLLQTAYQQISREYSEKKGEDADAGQQNIRAEILFDQLMLKELKENVTKLEPTAYAELKSYIDPPPIIHNIIKSVLSIFYPEKALAREFDVWSQCKQYISPDLSQSIRTYDPTATDDRSGLIPIAEIQHYLQEVPHGQVIKHGSKPADFLFNWVFVCVSLLEHSRKHRVRVVPEMEDETSPAAAAQDTAMDAED